MRHDELDLVRRAYPDLNIGPVRPVEHSGQFSNVYLADVDNELLVFRFPRNQHVAAQMTREVGILRVLTDRVSLPIPDPLYTHIDPQTGLLAFMAYPLIAGNSAHFGILDKQDETIVQRFARQLAEFLKELHSIPPASLGLDLPIEGTRDEWQKLYSEFREKLYPFMRTEARQTVTYTFETALDSADLWHFTPVLRHGDFGTRNILYDPQTMSVTGVIDFSEAGLGDPAQDVGAVWSLGANLMPHFFAYYPEMQAVLPRVEFIRSTYALQQALFALRDSNSIDFEDGIQAYR